MMRARDSHTNGWLPHPVLSLVLAASWLLLQQAIDVANLLAAASFALGVPWLVGGFLGPRVRPRALHVAVRLFFLVLWDIVVSNFTVARIVLDPRARPRPAWVTVPLDIQHPNAIVLLATIITTTPGTVSCVVDEVRGTILVHALDCDDPAEMARQIKERYEQPLKEILG